MANPTKSNNLGFRIIGSDGNTSILSTMDMFMKCDLASGNLNLYTKSKPTGVAIPHDTNWDASINSFPLEQQAIPGFTNNGDLEFTWKDFSTNPMDSYYPVGAQVGIDYTISANWSVNDAVVVDDIAIVATKDWTSTEKIVLKTPLTDSFKAVQVGIGRRTEQDIVWYPVTYITYTNYYYRLTWFKPYPCEVMTGGTLLVQGLIAVTTYISAGISSDSQSIDFVSSSALTLEDVRAITAFSGSPSDFPWHGQCVPTLTLLNTLTTQEPDIPAGAVQVGNQYYFPSQGTALFGNGVAMSNIIIPNAHFLFDMNSIDDKKTLGISTNEYFDYSDIFFDILFYKVTYNQYNDVESVVPYTAEEGNHKYTYKYGGFQSLDWFVSIGGNYPSPEDDPIREWYVLLNDDGYQFGVVLSSQVPVATNSKYYSGWMAGANGSTTTLLNNGIKFQDFFKAKFTERPSTRNSADTFTILPHRVHANFDVPHVANIEVYKLINFPNCGKIDIFTRSEGHIESIANNLTILSKKHKLKTLDRIKITGALSTDLYNKTNLNGIFYVNVITEDTFQICIKKDLVPLTIENYRTGTTQWTKVGSSNNWNYDSTIYSPNGKNGYSIRNPHLFRSYETPTISDDLNDRAVVHYANYEKNNIYGQFGNRDPFKYNQLNYSPYDSLYPQGYFNGARSWNNFYPFERFANEDETALGIVNGNNFGQCVQLKKYSGNEYILMVTEPGALESYTALERYNNNKKFNKKVLPSYMPYGRIHFYKIVKTSNSFTIDYLISVSKGWYGANPSMWQRMEQANFYSRGQLSIPNNNGASYAYLNSERTYIENFFIPTYWDGALYTCWSKDFVYSSTLDINVPNRNLNIVDTQDFYCADYFGKSADFEIVGNDLYCITSTNVKSANFSTNTSNRLKYTDATCQHFNIKNIIRADQDSITNGNFAPPTYYSIGIIQSLTVNSAFEQPDQQKQYKEYMDFGNTVVLNNKKLIIGWKSSFREYETMYYYAHTNTNTTVDSYILKQTIYSAGQNNFGNYIVFDRDMLLTNKYEYYDAANNLLTNPIDTILTYRYDSSLDKFVYLSKVTPTIDLSSSIYRNVNTTQYQLDSNISYDNTTNNSASYIIDLDGRYDLYNGTLFLRDWNEISIFKFNDTLKKFVPKSHNFVEYQAENSTAQYIEPPDSIIRVGSSDAAATFDSLNEFDFGQFSESIQVMDFSTKIVGTELNVISSIDSKDTTYLPLFIKTSEKSNSDLFPLLIGSAAPVSGFLEMFIEPTKGKVEALETFIKVADPSSGNLELFMSPKWYNTGRLNMVIAQKEKNQTFELHTVSYNPSSIFPLFLYNPINVTGTQDLNQNGDPLGGTQIIPSISMYIESFHTGIPNGSTIMPLSIKTIESLDHASPIPLSLNGNIISSSSGIDLYTYSAGRSDTSSGINLYLERSPSGNPYETSMYLFINRPDAAQMNLFIYNNYNSGNMNLSTSGAYMNTNNINLYCSSGVEQPSGNQNLFIRGSFTL